MELSYFGIIAVFFRFDKKKHPSGTIEPNSAYNT